jgi:hypothetical protein
LKRSGLPGFPESPVPWLQKKLVESAYPRNPRLEVGKFTRFGKILGKSVFATPNQVASVAAN